MTAADTDTEHLQALQDRVAFLEQQVTTLTAAVDAASRLRLASAVIGVDHRLVGGRQVRRILEKGGLVRGYPETPCVD